ncbi:hypothetical protein AAZX31_02G164100 [Glycine max]
MHELPLHKLIILIPCPFFAQQKSPYFIGYHNSNYPSPSNVVSFDDSVDRSSHVTGTWVFNDILFQKCPHPLPNPFNNKLQSKIQQLANNNTIQDLKLKN